MVLSEKQRHDIRVLADVRDQVRKAWHEKSSPPDATLTIDHLFKSSDISKNSDRPDLGEWISKVEETYAGQPVSQVDRELQSLFAINQNKTRRRIDREESLPYGVLLRLGIIEPEQNDSGGIKCRQVYKIVSPPKQTGEFPQQERQMLKLQRIQRRRKSQDWTEIKDLRVQSKIIPVERMTKNGLLFRRVWVHSPRRQTRPTPSAPTPPKPTASTPTPPRPTPSTPTPPKPTISTPTPPKPTAPTPTPSTSRQIMRSPSLSTPVRVPKAGRLMIPTLNEKYVRVARSHELRLEPLAVEGTKVPTLSFDLSRVLFNPGVYHLQDPRSRVWNFDPYLGRIMPVSEFNFDALNKYITSSQDGQLQALTAAHNKRYSGSSSSLSGALSHFHFLLSGFRDLRVDALSRGFGQEMTTFTRISRSPSAIFLRWKDGTYAVDADKQYDSANILMSLGRSMEKLLTLPKEQFEQYRKGPSTGESGKEISGEGEREAYHYSQLGSFLLRSQLDCKDDRLPGSGVFDLKTRAVAGVRMMLNNHEEGMGYQIKSRHGTWESYEREYYDMMRSAFLKYSLQVRMGRMDGIFVAYHNIQRLFGFQYIPLPELDLALHGQTNETLGDREFLLSFKLLEDIFDQATDQYPEQSIRFHFEAREATEANAPFMYVFAEPMADVKIRRIQSSRKQMINEYEDRLFNPQSTESKQAKARLDSPSASLEEPQDGEPVAKNEEDSKTQGLVGWKLTVRNLVNGIQVAQVQDLTPEDSWDIEYSLVPLDGNSAERNYKLCKGRRQSMMDALNKEDSMADWYVRRLLRLSQEGAEWRRVQDEFEATRKMIQLYGDD